MKRITITLTEDQAYAVHEALEHKVINVENSIRQYGGYKNHPLQKAIPAWEKRKSFLLRAADKIADQLNAEN